MTAPVRPVAKDWRDAALCAQADPEAWYPTKGNPHTAAKQICGRCPVVQECLAGALDRNDNQDGIRGGLTATERRRLKRKQS